MDIRVTLLLSVLLLPLMIAVLGAVMAQRPPKRINHWMGYRTARSMRSQVAWDFANRLSGRLMCFVGAVMLVFNTIVMLFVIKQAEKVVAYAAIVLCCLTLAALFGVVVYTEHRLKKFDSENDT